MHQRSSSASRSSSMLGALGKAQGQRASIDGSVEAEQNAWEALNATALRLQLQAIAPVGREVNKAASFAEKCATAKPDASDTTQHARPAIN